MATDEQPHARPGLPQYPHHSAGLSGRWGHARGNVIPDRVVVGRVRRDGQAGREGVVYERIRNYIKRSLRRCKAPGTKANGLGFIMTIYRRRLTSSFSSNRAVAGATLGGTLKAGGWRMTSSSEDDLSSSMTNLDDRLECQKASRAGRRDPGALPFIGSFLTALAIPRRSKLRLLHTLIEQASRRSTRGIGRFWCSRSMQTPSNYVAEELNARLWPGQVLSYTGAGCGRLL